MSMLLQALIKIWIAEAIMMAVGYAMSPHSITGVTSLGAVGIFNCITLAISITVLPWLAAYRVKNHGGSRRASLLSAVSISGVMLATVSVEYIVTGNTLKSFEGFLILLFVLFVPIQFVFGWIGYRLARRHVATQI